MLKYVFCLVFILVSVAFFTLLERKILGYIHNRFGPVKVFFFGIFQPFRDALKLFSKDDVKFKYLNLNIYFFFSVFCLVINIFFWGFISFWGVLSFSNYSFIIIICIIGIGVYFLLFMGWCRNTKFSALGRYRASAQRISYEIIIIFCLLFFFYCWFSFNFLSIFILSFDISLIYLSVFIFFLWFLSCFAECNRSPFDFSEGESELVSGFNTEFRGGLFSFIFIGEYSSVIIFSFLTSLIFFKYFFLYIFFFILSYFYLWIRVSFPRLRYDILIMISWKSLSIMVLSFFFALFCVFNF